MNLQLNLSFSFRQFYHFPHENVRFWKSEERLQLSLLSLVGLPDGSSFFKTESQSLPFNAVQALFVPAWPGETSIDQSASRIWKVSRLRQPFDTWRPKEWEVCRYNIAELVVGTLMLNLWTFDSLKVPSAQCRSDDLIEIT